MHNHLFHSCIFTFHPDAVQRCPSPLFLRRQSRYTMNRQVSSKNALSHSGRTYSMDIKFSGSDANGFQFDQNAAPRPKKRAQAPQIDRQQGRPHRGQCARHAARRRGFLLSCSCPPSTCTPKSFTAFALLLCITYCICALLHLRLSGHGREGLLHLRQKAVHRAVPRCRRLLIVTALIGALTSWVVLRAKDYQALLPIENGSFTERNRRGLLRPHSRCSTSDSARKARRPQTR